LRKQQKENKLLLNRNYCVQLPCCSVIGQCNMWLYCIACQSMTIYFIFNNCLLYSHINYVSMVSRWLQLFFSCSLGIYMDNYFQMSLRHENHLLVSFVMKMILLSWLSA